jgi:tetratricopeptide (TPR) repeat protein
MLSHNFSEVKKLRSTGNYASALPLVRSSKIESDEDAFEAMICLFVSGNLEAVLGQVGRHEWKSAWSRNASQALVGLIAHKDTREALSLARSAVSEPGIPYDAVALYLILLHANRLIDEAQAYIQARLQDPPPNEVLLYIVMAEIAAATGNPAGAYSLALSVLSRNMNNFRAVLISSLANYELGNIHESLGYAIRAHRIAPGVPAVTLQLMRCQNKVGDYYAAIAAFNGLGGVEKASEFHAELGVAYSALGDREKAVDAYRKALSTEGKSILALRSLLEFYVNSGADEDLRRLVKEHEADIHGNADCVQQLGLDCLKGGDLDGSFDMFRKCLSLARRVQYFIGWPVPEPRIRHDYEQLGLLQQRGRLTESAALALPVLKRYYDRTGDVGKAFYPEGGDAEALRGALAKFHYWPDAPFSGKALGEADYDAVEASYFKNAPSLVVIDDFLTSSALLELRQFCEEATVWKAHFGNGYVGAFLSQGFCPRVLLTLADELRRAMPNVIGDHALIQAWAFKYDQRMRGINLHADLANVNVNFWITPDAACEDLETGGMIVYDVPAPRNWSFQDYNHDQAKIDAYMKERGAKPHRVSYKENRCVLFDSTLFHTTDELHFKPGYSNRRVNVTLLYGKALHF